MSYINRTQPTLVNYREGKLSYLLGIWTKSLKNTNGDCEKGLITVAIGFRGGRVGSLSCFAEGTEVMTSYFSRNVRVQVQGMTMQL